ncbi:type II toxin-antitoxin system RelE/ParE family toxin [Pseudomonas sp. Leaf127]|uniref:type II toxin-antitoxin system RelE/ParE family toxin n=1 Tax=Pseudomonas sp. Leaf127 TaxID=1736267 RepID=UPI000AF23BF6|nr:type II toxin-antitoxin system RelE/ParE family toxin [Pseudomonas sp. Leaf127]
MLKMTRKASLDLDEIFQHYKELVGAEQAEAIVDDVMAESQALERCSALDTTHPQNMPAVRELALKRWPFLTTYHVTPGSIQILSFLHRNGQPINQPLEPSTDVWVRSSVDVSGLRCYQKTIDGLTYNVPRGISREVRSAVWVVRIVRDKRVILQSRFADATFGSTLGALEAASIHLKHSGHACLEQDILQLDEHAAVHWRKRSGVGLCAVSYVTSNGPGRGETFFISTWKRVESGRGLDKFRAKLVETLACSHALQHDLAQVPEPVLKHLEIQAKKLMASASFEAFVEAGKRKAERIAVGEYVDSLR